MTSSPVISDWIEKAIAMVYHRECTSTESGVASQASWKNEIPTSSTVKHHKTKTAFLKLISKAILQKKKLFCPRDEKIIRPEVNVTNSVFSSQWTLLPLPPRTSPWLPGFEGRIHIKLWHWEPLLLGYEQETQEMTVKSCQRNAQTASLTAAFPAFPFLDSWSSNSSQGTKNDTV